MAARAVNSEGEAMVREFQFPVQGHPSGIAPLAASA